MTAFEGGESGADKLLSKRFPWIGPVVRKCVKFQLRFLYLETSPVFLKYYEVHYKETQLRWPEITAQVNL